MITKIELMNFKSHAHTVIEPGPGRVTAIVGPNGCGKTSLLQAVHCLTRTKNEPWDQVFKGRLAFENLGAKKSCPTKIALHSRGALRWQISVESDTDLTDGEWKPSVTLLSWNVREDIIDNVENLSLPKGRSITNSVPAAKAILSLPHSFYFKASSEKLAEPSYSDPIPPILEADGKGLAAVIAHLVLSFPEQVSTIEDSLRRIVPTIKKIGARLAKVKVKEKKLFSTGTTQMAYDEEREVTGQELFFNTTSADSLPAFAMSDGTLLVLGLLTLLYSPNTSDPFAAPKLILLDDIEAGLHPLAQRQLMQMLKDFAEKHNRQIILTSHSPYIIDELDAKDVWVMATDKEGISHTKRLSDHPDAKRALDVLTTGELWDAEGEAWVLEDTPAELVNA
ncbi:MAG TPA: AAA family ATPase [Blastocatellia bacterium]|nr:AAA family ATPase [Blastocatellia bacterium]